MDPTIQAALIGALTTVLVGSVPAYLQYRSTRKTKRQLESELAEAEQTRAKLEADRTKIRAESSQIDAQASAAQAETSKLLAQAAGEFILNYTTQMNQLRTDYQSQLSNVQAQMTAVVARLDAEIVMRRESDNRVRIQQTQIDELTRQNVDLNSKLAETQSKLADTQVKLDSALAELDRIRTGDQNGTHPQ